MAIAEHNIIYINAVGYDTIINSAVEKLEFLFKLLLLL